ncbi:hypothetical protein [Rhodococcus erythropolis]|uniref:hypothetical protein n=1 Tax=Rhodococcus erythropolis TaxID=1833 RepID=UPI0012D325E6|nr:hypothetical protein [Rhodococcus erythropolis]UKO86523.1 hypothetical protein ITJ47_31295 [Rhodococcus erythropolis]
MTAPLSADSTVVRGTPVITPGGLHPVRGGIRRRTRKYQGPVFQVHESGNALRPGDLLIPPNPDQPVILVSEAHLGALVSSSFLAVRPVSVDPLWLWAILNCQTGRTVRGLHSIAIQGQGPDHSQAEQFPIPVHDDTWGSPLRSELETIERSTRGDEEEAVETWWRTVDLQLETEWRIVLATPNPAVLQDGEPLEAICSEIVRGRPAGHLSSMDLPGGIPVADIRVLGGGTARRWVSPEGNPIVANEGDVLVAAVGTRAHARAAAGVCAVDKNVYALRLIDADQGPGLARYLNGQAGYARRQILLSGVTVPALKKTDLSRFPVPGSALTDSRPEVDTRPLAIQLERLLWS